MLPFAIVGVGLLAWLFVRWMAKDTKPYKGPSKRWPNKL